MPCIDCIDRHYFGHARIYLPMDDAYVTHVGTLTYISSNDICNEIENTMFSKVSRRFLSLPRKEFDYIIGKITTYFLFLFNLYSWRWFCRMCTGKSTFCFEWCVTYWSRSLWPSPHVLGPFTRFGSDEYVDAKTKLVLLYTAPGKSGQSATLLPTWSSARWFKSTQRQLLYSRPAKWLWPVGEKGGWREVCL